MDGLAQGLKWLRTICLMAALAILAVMGIGGLAGGRLLSVQTGSMRPQVAPGDALLVWPQPAAGLRRGEVIVYRSRQNPGVLISHRLIATLGPDHPGAARRLITQGDALPTPDPAVTPSQLVGRAVAVAPGLGRLVNFVHQPAGLLVLVYAPLISLAIYEVWRYGGRSAYYRLNYR